MSGLIYLFQRGDDVDPIVVVDRDGRVVRSWGKGTYIKAHGSASTPRATSGPWTRRRRGYGSTRPKVDC